MSEHRGDIFKEIQKKKPLLKLPSVDQKGREHAKYDLRQKKKKKKKGLRGKKRNSFVCLLLVSDPKQ